MSLSAQSHGSHNRAAKFIGCVGALDVDTARKAAHLAALNTVAVARERLGTLDGATRIVRLGVTGSQVWRYATSCECRYRASELLQDVFGQEKKLWLDEVFDKFRFFLAPSPKATPTKLPYQLSARKPRTRVRSHNHRFYEN